MNVGDLVRIQRGFCSVLDAEFDWIGMLIEYIPSAHPDDVGEWLVQWAYSPQPAHEHGYYLEVI
jgi:hypothetical protein